MQPDERVSTLRSLLARPPEPGTQAGFHFVDQADVGAAWLTDDGSAAVLVSGSDAWIYGHATPEIGAHLRDIGFRGTVGGATSDLDPRPAIPSTLRSRVQERTVVVSDEIMDMPGTPNDYLARPPRPADRRLILTSPGAWVVEHWPDPLEVPFARVVEFRDMLVGVGGPRTLSESYAEVCAWIAPNHTGQGVGPALSGGFFQEILSTGRTMTAVVRIQNTHALRVAEKIGWRPVGNELIVSMGDARSQRRHRGEIASRAGDRIGHRPSGTATAGDRIDRRRA